MENKIVFITGSATGLGKRTAVEFAQRKANVVINYRNSEREAKSLVSHLQNTYGVESVAIQGDISKEIECKRMVKEIMEKFGRIDMLINNAGPYIHERKELIEYDVKEWEYIINGNLNSVFYLCKHIIPVMREQKWGRVVNIGFEKVETAPGWPYRSAFAAAKTGVASLTKTLAKEEAQFGITVNMVCPGDIRGELKEADIQSLQDIKYPSAPIGRVGTGEDIARVICFLCETSSDFITGSLIAVTGGQEVITKKHE